jgi:hypothetical protein
MSVSQASCELLLKADHSFVAQGRCTDAKAGLQAALGVTDDLERARGRDEWEVQAHSRDQASSRELEVVSKTGSAA